MHYKYKEYVFVPFEYTKIENDFLKEIKNLIDTYPLKTYDFFKKIQNPEIAYFRDTTLIISLLKLSNIEITNLFEILKRFLRVKSILKIIYKKEFIIVHFSSTTITKIIKKEDGWMYVDYYFVIKKCIGEHVYLNTTFINGNFKREVDMFFYYNKKYYLFTDENDLFLDNNIIISSIKRKEELNKNRNVLRYYLANNLKEEQICKLVFPE